MGHGEGGIGRRKSRRGELTPLCSFPPWAEAHSETPDLHQQAPRCLWGQLSGACAPGLLREQEGLGVATSRPVLQAVGCRDAGVCPEASRGRSSRPDLCRLSTCTSAGQCDRPGLWTL